METMPNSPALPAPHRPASPLRIACATLLVAGIAACGGSDDADEAPTPDTSDAPIETTPDTTPGTAAESTDAAASDSSAAEALADARPCLDELGWDLAPGDEASTGLTADMMENLGIDELVTFTTGAGVAGTIEAYASPTQADLAEEGYVGSPLGYEVAREGDVVFKTTGPADALDPIGACLRGEEPDVAAETVVEEEAAPATTPPTTAPPATEPPPSDPPVIEPPATEPPPTDPESIDVALLVPEPPADLDGDRLTIFTNFASERLASQDVVFDGECLADWARSLPEPELPILVDPSSEEDDLQPETIPLLDDLYGCLDLVYLAGLFADLNDTDVDCAISEFEQLDIPAYVAQEGRDIDVVFRLLSDTAFVACS